MPSGNDGGGKAQIDGDEEAAEPAVLRFSVSLDRSKGLGLVLMDNDNEADGRCETLVLGFQPVGPSGRSGPAERCGLIEPGDVVVAVNEAEVSSLLHGQLLSLFEEGGQLVQIGFARHSGLQKDLHISPVSTPATSQFDLQPIPSPTKYRRTQPFEIRRYALVLFTSHTSSTAKQKGDSMRIEQLLNAKKASHETVYLDDQAEEWPRLLAVTGSTPALPLLVNTRLRESIGGYDDLQLMEDLGELDAILSGVRKETRQQFGVHKLSLRSKERWVVVLKLASKAFTKDLLLIDPRMEAYSSFCFCNACFW
jgi:hypothetical protein